MALIEKLTAIGDAIREKTNTTEKLRLDEMPGMISSITGGSSEPEAVITFYDWDGTVLHQYPRKTFESMSTLPIPPEMDGYTCDGWNYSLGTIKAMSGSVNVCTMYRRNDDLEEETETPEPKYVDGTKLYLEISADMEIEFRYMQSITNGVTVNWGDGETSVSESYGNTSIIAAHSYKKGNYVISFDILDGCTLTLGVGNSGYNVLGSTNTSNYYRTGTLKKAEIDLRNTKLNTYAFRLCIGIEDVAIGDGASQALPTQAFYGCYSLKNAELCNSITSVGIECFGECYRLKNIKIPESVVMIGTYAFGNCKSIRTIVIPKNVSVINNDAFNGCFALKEVTIKNGVKSIYSSAFKNCYSLRKIKIPNSATSIGQGCLSNCRALENVTLPSNNTTYGTSIFANCYALKKIMIPNTITVLSDSFFSNCNLKFIGIPKSVKTIQSGAFSGNYALRNASIGENVETLITAFQDCYAIEKIIIPPSVTTIIAPVFTECRCLKEMSLPETLDMGSGLLYNCSFDSSLVRERTLKDFEGKGEIGIYAFAGTPYLENITVKGDIKSYAFYNDYILSNVKISDGVKLIDNSAFRNDYSLENINFPETLNQIQRNAFDGCRSLEELTFPEIEFASNLTFNQCYDLKKVRFEGNVNVKGGSLFSSCYSLSNIEFSNTVTEAKIASAAFRDTLLEVIPNFPDDTTIALNNMLSSCYALEKADLSDIKPLGNDAGYLFSYCYSLESAVLPNPQENIKLYLDRTFQYCHSLKEMELPKNVDVIGYMTFAYCYALQKITFAEFGITTIRESAFQYCCNLKEIKIPRSVMQIYSTVFYDCHSLADIYLYPLTPPSVVNNYVNVSYLPPHYKIHVPKGHIEEYRAKWSGYDYGDHMIEFEYMQAARKSIKKNIMLSDASMTIKGMFVHSDFDDNQEFTVTCNYSGQNLENLSATYDWKADMVTLSFSKTNNVIYEKYEDIVLTVTAVGAEDTTASFTVQAKCFAEDLIMEYTVTNISTQYGFFLQDDGYYESNNQNKPSTYCLCRVDFTATTEHMYVDCIGEGEANYDFGILSKLDTTLGSNNSEDSSNLVQKSFRGNASYSETVTYDVPDAEQHFIYIKYKKDGSADIGKDCLRFRIRFLESEE